MATPDFLTLQDLYNKVGERKVIQYFDDDNDGDITDADEVLAYQQVMCEAESMFYSRLLRAYTDKDSCVTLAQNDEIILGHVAWVALELASERRASFAGKGGAGQFQQQYERAIREFDILSRGRARSKGESAAGTSGNVGGQLQPVIDESERTFVFAPNKNFPSGHGGFAVLLALGTLELLNQFSGVL